MQVPGREAAATILQLILRWPSRISRRDHACLARGSPTLEQVTGRAGSDNIIPTGLTAARPWLNMVKGQVLARATILAGEAVA